ncbi:MAG: rhodanese-like domain-containing protein [Neisseriaceae bacterium]|nr:rhodanese-like domain-containing protein [Neisseriaceae bacterium]
MIKSINGLLVAMLIATGSLTACSTTSTPAKPHAHQFAQNAMLQSLPKTVNADITPDEVQQIINNSNAKTIIVDARRPKEYAEGHIAKAVNLSAFDAPESEVYATLPDKNAEYVVYCKTGLRAEALRNAMIERGYSNVKVLGGLETHWKREVVK